PPLPRRRPADDQQRFALSAGDESRSSAAAPKAREYFWAVEESGESQRAVENAAPRSLARPMPLLPRSPGEEPIADKLNIPAKGAALVAKAPLARPEGVERFAPKQQEAEEAGVAAAASAKAIRTLAAAPSRGPELAGDRLRQPLPPRRPVAPPAQSLQKGPSRAASAVAASGVSVVIGEVKFDSDWNSSPNAVANLVDAYRRRVATGVRVEKRVVNLVPKEIGECQILFMTANEPFTLRESEVQALRAYLAGGGCLWVNDSSHEDDERFDEAFRREIKRVIDAPLVRLPDDHPLFSAVYDFAQGYLGYRVPPGDKYRVDFIEGIIWDGRLCVLYTRNDYADGMALDPNLQALRPSLTDLSPEEMQEGSIRFGINAVHYFLGGASVAAATADDRERLYPRAASIWQGDEKNLSLWQD
ncbi:MAG: DUF4159 domain-containing protein, partial [Planctomycetota bacterium]|nr:DUF4159 domain-containing protein [Planctomycetota bacterium]